jgi:hypothetical protein
MPATDKFLATPRDEVHRPNFRGILKITAARFEASIPNRPNFSAIAYRHLSRLKNLPAHAVHSRCGRQMTLSRSTRNGAEPSNRRQF